ncbi:MAG: alpha/beta hydrolase [Aggregatilineales bacterium]
MQESTGTLQTPDNQTLHTITWKPDVNAPRAVVMLVHGIGEHSGRYVHVAKHLTDHRFAVYSHDHRGHGRSTGERAYFDSFDAPVNDLKLYFDRVQAEVGDLPIFMYGHSMGSLISLLFCLEYQHDLRGLISTGTPINLDETAAPWMIRVGDFLSKYVPRLPFGSLDAKSLSHDKDVVQAYIDDPYVTYARVKLGMASNFVHSGRAVREKLFTLRLPLLILHGEKDSIAPKSGSEFIFQNAGSPDKFLKIYPELFHEIHNEPEQTVVLNDITAWLDEHV